MYGRRSIADPKKLDDDLLHIATDDDPLVVVTLTILCVMVVGLAMILLSMPAVHVLGH